MKKVLYFKKAEKKNKKPGTKFVQTGTGEYEYYLLKVAKT